MIVERNVFYRLTNQGQDLGFTIPDVFRVRVVVILASSFPKAPIIPRKFNSFSYFRFCLFSVYDISLFTDL